jgi:hypothetical protein
MRLKIIALKMSIFSQKLKIIKKKSHYLSVSIRNFKVVISIFLAK